MLWNAKSKKSDTKYPAIHFSFFAFHAHFCVFCDKCTDGIKNNGDAPLVYCYAIALNHCFPDIETVNGKCASILTVWHPYRTRSLLWAPAREFFMNNDIAVRECEQHCLCSRSRCTRDVIFYNFLLSIIIDIFQLSILLMNNRYFEERVALIIFSKNVKFLCTHYLKFR